MTDKKHLIQQPFPIRLVSEDETIDYESPEELGRDVEFVIGDDESFRFYDSEGRRLRVRVHQTEMALCDLWEPSNGPLVVTRVEFSGERGYAEVEQGSGKVRRAVIGTVAYPTPWNGDIPAEINAQETIDISLDQFDQHWMAQRFNQAREFGHLEL